MRDEVIDLCGQINFTRTDAMPLLERDAQFRFTCAGCGNCCRGREDIVLSGYDLWRIAARLRLPPQIVARGYCRSSIGRVSHLPVLRLAPVKENRNNCPFLTETTAPSMRQSRWYVRYIRWRRRSVGQGKCTIFTAHRLWRAGDRSKGAGLPCPLRCARPRSH